MKSFSILAVASAPLLASAFQQTNSGGAKIINQCSYDIPLQNVPSGNENVGSIQSLTLGAAGSSDNTYYQPWTTLGQTGGWSMKLAPNNDWNNIMQYEYTWTGDGQIWFDMSFVNGVESTLPDWYFIQAGQSPVHNAYQYSTDDESGMQPAVPTSATVTLVLCPENTGAGSTAAATEAPSSPAAAAPAPESVTSAAPAPAESPETTSTSTTLATSASTTPAPNKNAAPSSSAAPEAAAVAASPVVDYEVVTEYATQIVTAIVTETAHAKARRHVHGHKH